MSQYRLSTLGRPGAENKPPGHDVFVSQRLNKHQHVLARGLVVAQNNKLAVMMHREGDLEAKVRLCSSVSDTIGAY